MIKHNSVPLALVPETDDIAMQLAAAAEQTVRLTGIVGCNHAEGRAGSPVGQQGYTGPIPFHDVYYLIVSSCAVLPLVDSANNIN